MKRVSCTIEVELMVVDGHEPDSVMERFIHLVRDIGLIGLDGEHGYVEDVQVLDIRPDEGS